MLNCCTRSINPTFKLIKMVNFLIGIFIILIIIVLVKILYLKKAGFIFDAIKSIILIISIVTKHYGYMLLFCVFTLISLLESIESIGISFQVGFTIFSSKLNFILRLTFFIFDIFCVFVSFQVYKRMKFEYKVKMGYERFNNNRNRNNNERNNIHNIDNEENQPLQEPNN